MVFFYLSGLQYDLLQLITSGSVTGLGHLHFDREKQYFDFLSCSIQEILITTLMILSAKKYFLISIFFIKDLTNTRLSRQKTSNNII